MSVVNTGRAKDSKLLQGLRELAFVAATKFEFRAVHLAGQKNILPDLLSRWGEGEPIREKIRKITAGKGYEEVKCTQSVFEMTHTW